MEAWTEQEYFVTNKQEKMIAELGSVRLAIKKLYELLKSLNDEVDKLSGLILRNNIDQELGVLK